MVQFNYKKSFLTKSTMIKKSKTNILFFTNLNNFFSKVPSKNLIDLNRKFIEILLISGIKILGNFFFKKKLIWRFFFRKQATKHYFRLRRYRYRFFKLQKYCYLLSLKSTKIDIYKNILNFLNPPMHSYSLMTSIPRKNYLILLSNQSDFLKKRMTTNTNLDQNLILRKKETSKKILLSYFFFYKTYYLLYKFCVLQKNHNVIFNKTNSFFFYKTSLLLLI